MARISVLPINNVSGGEASIFPVGKMPTKYSTLMKNCYVSEAGVISKIPGYAALNTTQIEEELFTSFRFFKANGEYEDLCAGGGKVFKMDDGELEAIKTGLDTSATCYFAQINNFVIIANGVNAPLKYDGTSVTTLGGTPPAKGFRPHVHKNRVWFLDKSDRMMAYHSALNAGEDYTGDGSGYIDFKFVLKRGDELVDIITYVDLLVFIFRSHIAIYSGSTPSGLSSDFVLVQLIDGVGAVGTGVTVPVGTDIAILTDQGVTTLRQTVSTGAIVSQSLSDTNAPVIRAAISGGALAGVHYKKYGWLLFLMGSTIYGYSYTWKAWFRIVGADAKGFSVTGDGTLLITGTGYLYQFDSGWSFNGSPIEMEWDTAWLNLSKGSNLLSYPKLLEITSSLQVPASIDLSVEYDVKGAPDPINTTTFALGGKAPEVDAQADFNAFDPLDTVVPYETIRIPLFGGGRLMRLRFINKSIVGPIELSGFTVFLTIGR